MESVSKKGRLLYLATHLIAVFLLTFIPSVHAATFCVSDAAGLQDALTQAADNGEDDIVKIRQGTYLGNFVYASSEDSNLTLQGGFNADCSSQVLDPLNTVLDGEGIDHVLALSCQGQAVLSILGLTFQNGITQTMDCGGGLYIKTQGYAYLSNNLFLNNFANSDGGGLYIGRSGGTLANNSFIKNSAKGFHEIHGGAALIYGSCILINNIFSENTAIATGGCAEGGGIYLNGTSNSLSGNIFTKNTVSANYTASGGGAYIRGISSGSNTIEKNDFAHNSVEGRNRDGYGGGLYVGCYADNKLSGNKFIGNTATADEAYESMGGGLYGAGKIDGNTFTGNSASGGREGYGGGSYLVDSIITNNLFAGNSVSGTEIGAGGGSYVNCGTLTNNTLSGNSSSTQGGGLFALFNDTESTSQIYNNIIWKNSAAEGSDLYIDNRQKEDPFFSVSIQVMNNNFDQSSSGIQIVMPFSIDPSNLNDKNPVFVGTDDYHLAATSPCINKGTNSAPRIPANDKDGICRIFDETVDIGAYEYTGTTTAPPESPSLSVTTNGNTVSCAWSSVAYADGYTLFYAPHPYTGPDSISNIDMGAQTSVAATLREGASFLVAVQAYNVFGNSRYSNIELFEIGTSIAPNPTGLCICATGSRDEFEGLDVTLCWNPSTYPSYVKEYDIEILDTATMTRRRLEEGIVSNKWSYAYGMNKADSTGCADENSDGANDALTIRLWAVDLYGRRSEGYDEISVTNPGWL